MTKKSLLLIVFTLCLNSINAQHNTATGYKSLSFKSTILSGDREIWIHTPKIEKNSLNNPQSIFPVIYVLDGEHNFHNVVGVSKALARANLMPNVIVVGITGINREYDYSPSDLKVDYMKTGGGDNFLSFFANELIPYINNNYPSSNHNTLIGHSIGAMLALYALTESRLDLFNNHLSISPSLWWDNQSLAEKWKEILKAPEFNQNKLVFITMANEGILGKDGEAMHNQYLKFKSDIKNSRNFEVDYLDLFDEDHLSTVTPALHYGLKFLFKNWNIDHIYNSRNFSDLKKALQELSKIYNFNITPNYTQLVNMGRYFYVNEDYKTSIEIYELGLKAYPKGLQLNGFAAQAYSKDNQVEKAKEYLNKGLKIAISKESPMISWFRDQLDRLEP
ncbi:alpha/beta hydrolase-fold protein [uncultured Winogradskyella sp.]|uniref:alpha/beta hydrolase-fold protein n=1 Tax=uncultured Winogradskyella sp. TaxID=395353 RepID=UPI002617B6C8|nr:alpha/beta hydrolase-fold protein [uncultured Winogradskyella sp.]